MNKSLTDRQKAFVRSYMLDFNASAAALRVGYTHKAYGRTLVGQPHIQAAIHKAMELQKERTQLTVDDIIRELWHEANHADSAGARVQALKLLGKHLGMFTHNVRHSFENQPQVIVKYPDYKDLPLPDEPEEVQAEG
jgi:hypothetical protein